MLAPGCPNFCLLQYAVTLLQSYRIASTTCLHDVCHLKGGIHRPIKGAWRAWRASNLELGILEATRWAGISNRVGVALCKHGHYYYGVLLDSTKDEY